MCNVIAISNLKVRRSLLRELFCTKVEGLQHTVNQSLCAVFFEGFYAMKAEVICSTEEQIHILKMCHAQGLHLTFIIQSVISSSMFPCTDWNDICEQNSVIILW